MVRPAETGDATPAEAARRFGVSLSACVRITRAFSKDGVAGLVPARCGPQKIIPVIRAFVRRYGEEYGRTGATRLVPLIEAEFDFGVRMHRRGFKKALARAEARR